MRKFKRILIIYTVAALVTLSLYTAVNYVHLEDHRRMARYSSSRALSDAIRAVDGLNTALEQSAYAVDGSMCAGLCAGICRSSAAAEGCLAALPFNTCQLENTQSLLNTVGDYASFLSRNCGEGFSPEAVENLSQLGRQVSRLRDVLTELAGQLDSSAVQMDSCEVRVQNVGLPDCDSAGSRLLDCDGTLEMPDMRYDGLYGTAREEKKYTVDKDSAAESVNALLGRDDAACSMDYADGCVGLCCGGYCVRVGENGIENVGCSRLVSETALTLQQAKEQAEEYLRTLGCDGLRLYSEGAAGNVAEFVYVPEGDVLRRDCTVKISVAMDDGTLYALDMAKSAAPEEAEFTFSEEQAREKIPPSLHAELCTASVRTTAWGGSYPCYVFSCTAEDGRNVEICVNAGTGRQEEINLD